MPESLCTEATSTAEIRQFKRAQRRLLSPVEQKRHGEALLSHIIHHRDYLNCKRLALYLANDGEIDPQALVEHAWFMKKQVFLPVLSPLKNNLYFAPYKGNSRMRLNRFNIPEPVCKPSQWLTARQLDLIALPLVAFDTEGNRIGMGGGFYDRTLAFRLLRQYWHRPVLIGLAHETQKMGSLSRQNWDIPLDYVITEKQAYPC